MSLNTTILEEGNYEGERYRDKLLTWPVYRQMAIWPGVYEEVWEKATIFFKWQGETYCIGIKDNQYGAEYLFQVITKTDEALKKFLAAFREYKRSNHYLKGKKFIGVKGELMPLSHYGWGDIVLPDGLAEKIHAEVSVILRVGKTLTKYGLNSKKGFILAGDPGNGKTLLLKILANTVEATCILVPFTKDPEERDMSAIFTLARDLSPTVLILEDVDLYGEERGHCRDNEHLGELMNELDGMIDNKEIIVFATTNHLSKVEKALQNRPGRFDRVYKILNPDFNGRRRLLELFINKVPNVVSKEEVDILAENFAGYSGTYLKELVNSGFAQAVLKNEADPVLTFEDLVSNVDVLKNREKRVPIGFDPRSKEVGLGVK